jgi:heat shock protein HslJ
MLIPMKAKYSVLISTAILVIFLLASCAGATRSDPLNGTAWTLTSIDNSPPIGSAAVTVEFTGGQIGGSSGCNSYSGSYKVQGEKITTDAIAMTLMACADSRLMEQEQTFLGYLQNTPTFKLSAGQLQIIRSDGKVLTFKPKG